MSLQNSNLYCIKLYMIQSVKVEIVQLTITFHSESPTKKALTYIVVLMWEMKWGFFCEFFCVSFVCFWFCFFFSTNFALNIPFSDNKLFPNLNVG